MSLDLLTSAAGLSLEQRELLQNLLLEKGAEFGVFPLSSSQERLWFLHQLAPGAPAYNIAGAFELRGPLDVRSLAGALQEIAQRHEILRTSFLSLDGRPVQTPTPAADLRLPVVDLRALPEAERRLEAEHLVLAEARHGFDLAAGPPVRASLLALDVQQHTLLLVLHHITSDGWSSRIIAREMAALYQAFSQGLPSPLPELPLQYADYAVWQREWLESDALKAQASVWRRRLAGLPPLDLPTDRPRPHEQSFRGAREPVLLSRELTTALAALCTEHGVTLFGGLLAAFQILLGRYSGQGDFAVGSPSANRNRAEIEDLVGCFVNTLPLRADLGGDPGFVELLGRVRDVMLEMYENQEVPFEKLVEEIEPVRHLGRAPLIQAMLALQAAPLGLRLPGLELRLLEIDNRTAKLDLLLSLVEGPHDMAGSLEYNTDLFDGATMRRLLGHFTVLLEAVVRAPERRIGELYLLSDQERAQVLVEWSDGGPLPEDDLPAEPLVHTLFGAQARRTPEAVALVAGAQSLTYGELAERASQLAAHLRRLGVGPESRVGIFLDRTPQMVVSLLGVLSAGAAYLPLDPAYPQERVDFMLRDAGAAVVLSSRPLAARLPDTGARTIFLEEDLPAAEPGSALPPVRVSERNLAYVIYTSGSTGRPKGVAIEHASAVALLRWARRVFGPEELSGVAAVTSICFDLSVFELFAPLAWGGRVLLLANALELPTLAAADACRLVNTVPSALAELVRTGGLPASVRTVNLAGEPLPGWLARAIHAAGVEKLYNLYGPSEDTTYSTGALIAPEEATPPIGRPLPGTRAYVLDHHLELVPPGIPGELFLGGAGLARGYLGRPELTAERFVPDGIGGRHPGARLYRTGDRVRHRPDGSLEYLGRLDQQVKVRGFRIELGEIEAALIAHPGVRDCAVATAGQEAERSLAAFLVPEASPPPGASELRAWVRARLPEHMVPARFPILESLPLTPGGKVDRRVLTALAQTLGVDESAGAGGPAQLPRDPVEEILAGIWEAVLGVEQVGIRDDFFALGGHSLLVVRAVARVHEALGVHLAVREIFERPTVAALAERITELRDRQTLAAAPPLRPVFRGEGSLPLSFAQERLWLLDRLEHGSAYNMPLALRLAGPADPAALEAALNALERRHEALRTTFPERDGHAMQLIAAERTQTLPVVDLSGLSGEAAEREALALATAEARRPFDLARGPLLRSALVRLSSDESVFVLTLHHIIADGWSLTVLTREIEVFYAAALAGRPAPLPRLAIQPADHAVWQREWLRGEVLEERLIYWRRHLAGAPALLELSTDHPRAAVPRGRGARQRALWPAELGGDVAAFAHRELMTPFVVALTAFMVLLSRYSGQEDLAVGSPTAGREHIETEGLIGCFINTLVLRAEIAGAASFRALLGQVRETALDAWAHQDLPFEKLVEALAPVRNMSHAPLFQVMLAFQSLPLEVPRLPGVQTGLLEIESGSARLDLTLALLPSEEGWTAVAEHSTDLFDGATIARLLGHFAMLLEGAVKAPERPAGELPLLSEHERAQLLEDWSAGTTLPEDERPAEPLVHALFTAQALRTPEAVALEAGRLRLTYAELAERSVRLAAHLRELGVGPESRVGIFLDRTPEMVVALLGALTAGAAYVPLDPAYPQDRVDFMLRDSGAAAVLTCRRLAERLPETPARTIFVEDDLPLAEAGFAPVRVSERNLAYVIYTSGSTGRPKGVAIEHASAVALLLWARRAFDLEELSGVAAVTSISFDLSVFELFAPLAWGGRVLLLANALEVPALAAAGACRLVNTVPSAMAELVRTGGLPASVRTVNLAGEPLPAWLVRALHAVGVQRVYNLYGPSEDTTYSTWALVRPEEATPPIGCPLPGTVAYVLDRRLGPVPPGVPGELYLGGAGLARGYLGRPELTAERFVPDGVDRGRDNPGARLYRTGDRVRYRPDGSLEYLGRLDQQVKVRGFRIELGEIETVLTAHPGIRDCAVVAAGQEAGLGLVAFVVPEGGSPGAAELRAWLRGRLPEHMVPARFPVLPALPLTPGGKVDRRALAATAGLAPTSGMDESAADPGGAPRHPMEEILAGIWEEVLGVERIGLRDDFFARGGHSLLAVRAAARVREALGVDLAVREIFERPTVAALAERIVELRDRSDLPAAAPLRPFARGGAAGIPLSFAQERLWLLDRLEHGSAYNMPGSIGLRGTLRPAALAWSLGEIVRRHEALRTRFEVRGGRPLQRIDPPAPPALPVIDLAPLPVPARAAETARLEREEHGRPFDLAAGPLLRVRLLCLGAEEHRLLVTIHHAAFDGWSLGLFVRELAALYAAAVEGRPARLRDLPVQYADWAVWQRQRLAGEVLAERLAFWRGQLAGAPAAIEIPTDRPRTAVAPFQGGRVRRVLAPDLADRLRSLGRREGATSFMILLAAFGLFLRRLSGQEDVVIGAPAAERDRVETENLIGIFLNTLALRLDLSGDLSFLDLLARARAVALGVYAHQDLPFEKLLEELQPARDPGRTPLFQVFLNVLSFPRTAAELPGLELEVAAAPELPAKLDLTLYAAEVEGGLALDLAYDARLFDAARAAGMLDQIAGLLDQAAAAPAERVGLYSLVTPAAAALLPEPTAEIEARWDGGIPAAVARWAATAPERLAVRDTAGSWTWGELALRSRRLAGALTAARVGRGDVVAVWAHRSAPLVQALLGVLEAGAAFTVLDPAYPVPRLLASLAVARPVGWLRLRAAGDLPAEIERYLAETGPRLHLELTPTAEADPLADRPVPEAVAVAPDDPAYVAFTSGSTGAPKGILGTHRPLSHFLHWYAGAFDLGPGDHFSLLSGLSHDPLLRDIFAPLWTGAALAIPDPDALGTPGYLREWMARESITVTHLTPATAQWLAGRGGPLTSLRHAVFGGDTLTRRDVEALTAVAPVVVCTSFYGTTETPQAMGHLTLSGAAPLREKIPAGRGIEGVQLLVLTPERQLAGIGELGEIHVRTPYLAVGYIGDEALTAARFLANPFTGRADDRVYRTGDLGRYLPDGTVEVVGRVDAQIKIRGNRIEPAEIEAALESHPAVARAAVIAREDLPGDFRLVAYLVPKESAAPASAGELQGFLRALLPAPMIPAAFVPLSALPLTPNGKLDRRALPAPAASAGSEAHEPPRNPLEITLAGIWSRVLGIEQVGIRDSFFELGGHSLLATRLLAQIEEDLGAALPLRDFFAAPTIAGLAELLAMRGEEPGFRRLPVLVPAPAERGEPFPLTEIQQAYWIGRSGALELGNVASHRYLEIESAELDLERFAAAWRRLVERHDMLRAVVLPDGRQRILPEVPPYVVRTDDLRCAAPDAVEAHLEAVRREMSHQVMDPARWPLFELRATRLGDRWYRLQLSFDYLIADAWSFQILLRELTQLYDRPETELPPLALSFRDYVLAEVALQSSERYQRSLAYWQGRIATLPPAPELPAAPGARLDRPHFRRRTARLDPAAWGRVRERASQAGLTPSGLLLAAFSEVLAAWSKGRPFTLVLTLFQRLPLHPEVDRLLGDFTSTLLLETGGAAPGEGFEARAQRLQSRLWEDLDHSLVSGVRVLRELARVRQGGAPLPVVFTSTLGLRARQGESEEARLPGEVVFGISQTPQVTLDHQIAEHAGSLILNWDALEDIFPAGMLDAMFAAYCGFLDRLARDPGEGWREAPRGLVPAADLEQRVAVNATAGPRPEGLLHGPFEEQASRGPGRLAVAGGDVRLAYGELDRLAAGLGTRLRRMGARPERLVAVAMDKGWEQIAAVLAVLRSGAAYLPLDPSLPAERFRNVLELGEVEIALTQPHLLDRLAWPAGVRPVAVDRTVQNDETPPLTPVQRPEDLAYVIFTSGSTGVPKGVMIEHQAALNTVADVNRRFRVGPEDRVLALSALGFDLSVYDLFGLLGAGGAVVLPDPELAREPAHWLDLLRREGVTVWNTVPALMVMLADHLEAQGESLPSSLRLVLMSGDWIPVTLPGRLRALAPDLEIVSLGGATEASIWSILYPIAGVDPEWRSVPYGRPMTNQTFHVLDDDLEPRPLWVTGQLYIGGIGVARGYWGDAEKTAASFLVHPRTGERLYRTGDLGRYLPSGDIEFLGREDFQVKVHGYRIELGEIEATLAQHPGVRACVAAVRGERHGDKLLVAYVVADPEAAPEIADLRSHLASRLPSYMVPPLFVLLDALPLSATGKVDRAALPDPGAGQEQRGSEDAAPRTPVEERVAGLFAEVLEVERVGLHDHFFAFGGNSLKAMLLISRVREAFQVELPLGCLFESPTVADIALEILKGQGISQGIQADSSPPIEPRPSPAAPAPLSFAQERLWFLSQLDGGSAYNNRMGFLVHEEIGFDAFAASFAEIRRRHEVLRTVYTTHDGQPGQVVLEESPDGVPLIDLSALPEPSKEAEGHRIGAEEGLRPFDLERETSLRVTVVRLRPGEHLLLLIMHHIATDGWSWEVLFGELALCYEALSRGQSPALPALPIQYADFALWQRGYLQKQILESQLAYWTGHLAGAPPAMELPTDRPRPPQQTFRGANEPFELPAPLCNALRELCRGEEATLFMGLLAALQALLGRHARQDDVVVGSPVAGRSRPEVEPLIGVFVNTLPLRTDLSGNPTFRELLGRVRQTALGAFGHQDLPFEQLVAELGLHRDLSRSPVFQVLLVVQNTGRKTTDLSGLRLAPLHLPGEVAKIDLELAVIDRPGSLPASLEYNTDLFERATVLRLLGHLEILLQEAVREPQRRLADLPLLSEPERAQLLREWNDTREAVPDAALPSLLAEQAGRTPEAVAVVFADRRLTWCELDGESNRLAHRLRRAGVGPEVLVGLSMQRSADLVVALLGILKAGGAYLPLDPAYPRERLAVILDDARPRVLLTEQVLATGLFADLAGRPAEVLCLDAEREALQAESDAAPAPNTTAGNLAYVLYTSGSTGKPKGVEVPHQALVNFLDSMRRAPGLAAGDRLLSVTSLSFDIAALEIFLPLLVGGSVELASREETIDGTLLAARIASSGARALQATPATWRMLLDSGWSGQEGLRVLCGGEALPLDLAAALSARTGALWNLYGPTETTVWSAVARFDPAAHRPTGGSAFIGRPIANTTIHLLDSDFHPVPAGVPGELYIAGRGVTRGYLGRPDLTAERFVPDPFALDAAGAGARLYRTGDLARHGAAGAIEFLGRRDNQIKVRGFRIELGDIEAALSRHPAVREVAVLLRTETGDPRLVAYVVPAAGSAPQPNDLRAFLRERLPEHMEPACFVILDAFPLTPNRKVDRKALPAPQPVAVEGGSAAPQGPVEEAVAEIWADVLRRGSIGRQSDFFALGGHSLLATQAVSRLRRLFRIDLPLRALFEAPTPARLSRRIEELQRAGAGGAFPPLHPRPHAAHVPLSFSQQRLWFLYQMEPSSSFYNLPVAVRLRGELDRVALARALSEVVRRHESLRTTFAQMAGEAVQVVGPPSPCPLPLVDLSALPAAGRDGAAHRLMVEEAVRTFDLAAGPLLRATLLHLGECEHRLLLTVHHIVSDAWSMELIVREMIRLYEAGSADFPALPPLPIQYADFACWQRQWLQGETLETQIAYWRERLATAPAVLELRTDRPRPAAQTFRGSRCDRLLPVELREALASLARRRDATLFMVLLAGFQVLLYSHSGKEDFVCGTDVANRNCFETEELVGFFVNQLALRADLSGNPTFVEILDRVREATLGAYAHQDLPFNMLVEVLRPERSPSYSPIFQVAINFRNIPRERVDLSALTMDLLELPRTVAQLDLQLNVVSLEEGLRTSMDFNTDLFENSSVSDLLDDLEVLLRSAVDRPEATLEALERGLARAGSARRALHQQERQEVRRSMLGSVRRKTVGTM